MDQTPLDQALHQLMRYLRRQMRESQGEDAQRHNKLKLRMEYTRDTGNPPRPTWRWEVGARRDENWVIEGRFNQLRDELKAKMGAAGEDA